MPETRTRAFDFLGILMKFHVFPAEVQDKNCLVEALVPEGAGTLSNHHAGETECFHVLNGQIGSEIDGTQRVARRRACTDSRRRTARVPALGGPARVLPLSAPGRMHDAFFADVGKPLPADATEGPAPDGPLYVSAMLCAAADVGMMILEEANT